MLGLAATNVSRGARQEDLCKLQASLVYTECSSPAMVKSVLKISLT